jgi:hypothetical protein
MNTYEVTQNDGSIVSVIASGYSWDKQTGGIAFYHANGDQGCRVRKRRMVVAAYALASGRSAEGHHRARVRHVLRSLKGPQP